MSLDGVGAKLFCRSVEGALLSECTPPAWLLNKVLFAEAGLSALGLWSALWETLKERAEYQGLTCDMLRPPRGG